jgi:hypothetical protein
VETDVKKTSTEREPLTRLHRLHALTRLDSLKNNDGSSL